MATEMNGKQNHEQHKEQYKIEKQVDGANALSIQLRYQTQAAHTQTEDAGFVKRLFKGECTNQEYYAYLWSLHQVYQQLEQALTLNRAHALVSPIYFEELFRTTSLEQDLSEWQNFSAKIPQALSIVAQEYRQHLNHLAMTAPELLVAHAYVRYLGDLSGGQILAKIMSRRFPDGRGLNFYSFPFDNIAGMKKSFREGLDLIGQTSEAVTQAICGEAIRAFELNSKVFEALGQISSQELNGVGVMELAGTEG